MLDKKSMLYNTKKISLIFICMKIFQHFCDVFALYYKIIILNFHHHTLNVALWDILF